MLNVSVINNKCHINDDVTVDESNATVKKLKKLTTSYFFRPDRAVINELKNIKTKDLTNLLTCLFEEMVKKDLVDDPQKIVERLAEIIPLEKLTEAIGGDVQGILEEAKEMFEEAKLYLETTKVSSPTIRSHIRSIINGIVNIIESIITAFGLGDFFKPGESESQGNAKAQKFFMLISLFGTLSGWVLPLIGAATGGAIVAGILLTIVALSLLWPHIKPLTTYLPCDAENLTLEVQKGTFAPQGRKESLDEIANILQMGRHAILVGKSRVGKSLTAKAFAKAIERGDYPELKGKVVFRINTSKLLLEQGSLFGGSKIIEKISSVMGRHRDDIILVLDEIHMACKGEEKLAEQLKTYLDEDGDFSHVIGITTSKEYKKYVKKNDAFSLRFDKVDIRSTDKDETLRILADTLLRSRIKPLIEEGALDLIYDKGCENQALPQPAASLKLLKRCINQVGKTQKSPTQKRIVELSNKILSLRSQAAVRRGMKKDGKDNIAELEKELAELQKTLSEERKKLKDLFKSKELLDRVTDATYSSVLKLSSVANNVLNSKNEKQLKIYILLHQFLGKSLETFIQNKSEDLGVKTEIDQVLIEEVAKNQ